MNGRNLWVEMPAYGLQMVFGSMAAESRWRFVLRRIGEGLSEAGVLFAVFGILDVVLTGTADQAWMFGWAAAGFGLFAAGLAVEAAWRR